jgi:hypothetical protein
MKILAYERLSKEKISNTTCKNLAYNLKMKDR